MNYQVPKLSLNHSLAVRKFNSRGFRLYPNVNRPSLTLPPLLIFEMVISFKYTSERHKREQEKEFSSYWYVMGSVWRYFGMLVPDMKKDLLG